MERMLSHQHLATLLSLLVLVGGAKQEVQRSASSIGECSYTNSEGQFIKIKFSYNNGRIKAKDIIGNAPDAKLALEDCWEHVGLGRKRAEKEGGAKNLFQAGRQEPRLGASSASVASFGGVAFSEHTGVDGVTRGQCSFVDSGGRSLKVSFERENGHLSARMLEGSASDPVAAYQECKQSSERVAQQTQQEVSRQLQIQGQFLRRQQQELAHLQRNLFRQYQEQAESARRLFRDPDFPWTPPFTR